MSVNHKVLGILLLVSCISVLATPVLAIYTTSDIGGSLVRGHQFTVEITGKPNTSYYMWLTKTWPLSGEAGDQPPVIVANQWNVQQDPAGGPYTIGSYQYYNGGGRTILDDVAPTSSLLPNTSYYALITTDDSGQAVVAFGTSMNTALQSYSVRVENPTSVNNNTLLVQRGDTSVTKGAISIGAESRPTRPITTISTPVSTINETPPTVTTVIITPEPTAPVTMPTTTPSLPVDMVSPLAAIGCGLLLAAGKH